MQEHAKACLTISYKLQTLYQISLWSWEMTNPCRTIGGETYMLTKQDRQALYGNRSFAVWFTGLSGAGKSTIARALDKRLYQEGKKTYLLDGDQLRTGLNRDLGFSERDRNENIRRIGEVAQLFVDAGVIVLVAAISPYRADRLSVRSLFQPGEFIEAYIQCRLEECERRDPKGLYKKARSGTITNFTGISAPYECPEHPEITVNTENASIDESVDQVLSYLRSRSLI